ncbi:M28 family peptidase [Algoriphagus taiwanensis]|uniref:M28 family peptidase n=1 Tax=Algoriphagus taiwanensis TaxID=1445656 RepID=A0ABQ6PXL1_9BACT|nr:M28 family peptidase [Algoriphagus taiwanensis]
MKKAQVARIVQDVQCLTDVYPARNYRNLESLKKIQDYLVKEMTYYGYETHLQTWTALGNDYSNVICSYQPEKEKRLIIGAHYDVCGNTPGADDNASAVAGLLETLRLISENKPNLDFGIDFVAYCLEEPPFFGTELMGSYVHAKSIAPNRKNILGMICYEMIGYFSDEPGSQKFPDPSFEKLYPSTGNFIMTVGIEKFSSFNDQVFKGMKEGGFIEVEKVNMPESNGFAGLSDQRNYWTFGIPAMMINDTSFLRNPNYHELGDTIDTLDFKKMSGVVDAAIYSILNFSSK